MNQAGLQFYTSNRYKWFICLGTGLFFYFFLLAFLPFGVDNYNPNHEYSAAFLVEMLSFMLGTTILMLANEFMLKGVVVREVHWRAVFGWSAWLLLSLGIGIFFLYNWLGNWHDLSWSSAFMFVVNCSTVFIFPLVGIFFLFRYQALKNSIQKIDMQRQRPGGSTRLIQFHGDGRSDRLAVAADDFRYAQAQDNYVALFYLKNGEMHKELIRSTLSELLEKTAWTDLVRCHRSYAINLLQVRSVQQASPMLVFLQDLDRPIRVSRSYRQTVLNLLQQPSERP